MNDFVLGLRLAVRMLRAGELSLLAAAIALAVAAMATVGLFADRARLALEQQSNRLLGADLVLRWTRPIAPEWAAQARARGLRAVETISFRSMLVRGDQNLLAEVTAVDPGYPLRGATRIATARSRPDAVPDSIPASGTVWADERLFGQTGARVGDRIALGNREFVLAAVLTQDPSLTLGILGMGPRLVMARSDVAATGLIGPGSRAAYRVLLAGDRADIEAYRAWAQAGLPDGMRSEGVREARPEVRSALERAGRFMSLAALVAVALAAVAVMLAARRFHQRQLDVCAMLRCLGATQGSVFRIELVVLLCVGVLASLGGSLVGFAGQSALSHWLASLLAIELPPPSVVAVARANALGIALLLSFGLPPLIDLRAVPALRVLRREVGRPRAAGASGYALGIGCVAALVIWHAGEIRLGAYVLLGCLTTLSLGAVFTWVSLHALKRFGRGRAIGWRYGVASLRRRSAATVWQVVALALGLTALLTLTVIRSDLLNTWQRSLPADAPNRFVINIEPDQVPEIQAFIEQRLGQRTELYPSVRGRLVAINGRAIDTSSYPDDRAKRLLEREFNLGSSETLPLHNRIVAGAWHGTAASPGLSVEEGIAGTLGLELGDRLTYDVAGVRFEAPITSLRQVEWDSFRVNFFVIASSRLLASHPTTYITSFHLPSARATEMNELVQRFPNVVVIDVEALLSQVQAMMEQVARAIGFIFVFTLAAGVLVLYAGIVATHDERVREVAIMRTLGASRRQVASAHAAEFFVIGALAGLFAAAAATGLGYALAVKVLDLPYRFDPQVWIIGFGAGVLGVVAAGMWFTRTALATPPLTSLRQMA